MLADNYLGRQIDVASRLLSMLLLQKDVSALAAPDNELSGALDACVLTGDFGGAEDLLFESLSADASPETLAAAIAFYRRLNGLRDAALEAGGFTREEILEGLEEIKSMFGVETDL